LLIETYPSFAGVLADSTAGFSGVQGANNWYYGYFPGGNLGAFTQLPKYNGTTQVWEHITYGPPWTLVSASVMHPNGTNDGAEEWADREWVSTYSGPIIVAGHLAKADTNPSSTGVYGRIYLNHQLVYQQFIAGTDGVGVNYSMLLTPNQGDVLDFSLAPNGSDGHDATQFSATISTEYDSVTADFGAPVSVTSALGFLDGFLAAGSGPDPAVGPIVGAEPINSLILPLQPQYWRGTINEYLRIHPIAPAIPFDLVLSFVWGWAQFNYEGHLPPWQDLSGYQSAMNTFLSTYVASPANLIFEVWNEPDDGWAVLPGESGYQVFWTGTAEQFYETYLAAFQTIRQVLGPSAIVAGPSFANYSHQGIQDFLEYCLANGCEVNALTWHECGDASAVQSLPADVQDARTSFLQNPRYAPLRIQRIDVNEIVGPTYTPQPAGTLAYYSALEASGANAAAHSCWTDTLGNVECADGTLDGLLTDDTFQPCAAWWLHRYYAAGVAARVQATTTNADIFALASSSITGATTPQILIGNSNYQDTVSNTSDPVSLILSLANLQAVPAIANASSIDASIELIPNSGYAAVNQLNLLAEINVPVDNGAAQIRLPPIDVGQVYRVTMAPHAGPSPCDIGSYGTTNLADVQKEIDQALGTIPAANDLNGDGLVNVIDVQFVIDSALGLGCVIQ
jgi:hypothetical protein